MCAHNVHLSYPPVFDRPDVTSREGWPMALYRWLSWVGTYVCAVVVVFCSSSIPHDDYRVVFIIVILHVVYLQHTHHIHICCNVILTLNYMVCRKREVRDLFVWDSRTST